MKLPILSFYSALILAAFGVVSAIGQIPPKPTEVQRLTEENQLLRQQLAEAQGKAQSKAVATKSVSSKTDARVIVSEKAQTESGSATTFLDKIFLRKSVFDENALAPGQITDPAQFTYVHPGHGKDTYSIDTGLAATFITPQPGAWQVDWGIGADYHRNSDVSSVKDLFQAGFIADAIFGNAAEGDFVRLKANVSYRDDNVKNLQAVAAGFDVLPIVAFFRIDNFHRFGPAHWRWQPFAGLRYEDSIDEGPVLNKGIDLPHAMGWKCKYFRCSIMLRGPLRQRLAHHVV